MRVYTIIYFNRINKECTDKFLCYVDMPLFIIYVVVPSFQQLCSGRCGSYINIDVTIPESVIIPCGDLQLSNTSMADYCNATDGINKPLVEGATAQYNLTTTEISHNDNVIYCTNNQRIFCYKLTVFCKELADLI